MSTSFILGDSFTIPYRSGFDFLPPYREDASGSTEKSGRFQKTRFRDVVRSRFQDWEAFLQEIEKNNIFTLSKVMSIQRSFISSPATAAEKGRQAVNPLLHKIKEEESLGITFERRGYKGVFSSQKVAAKVGTFISEVLERRDEEIAKVNLGDPDKAVVFETLHSWGEVGIIPKEMTETYFYINLP